jgi:hypothetical protein
MRFVINPRAIAVLIACMIVLLVSAEAHAYYIMVIPILVLDAGVTYANARALANDEPNNVTGVAGLTLGSLVAIGGAGAAPQVEEPWELVVSLGIGALGVASAIYGWRVIRSSRQHDDVVNDGQSVRLIPMLPIGDRSERQFGLIAVLSY